MTRIESIQQQDEAAKHSLRFDKAILAGLGVGLIFFFVSRGLPWFSAEIPDAAMGRPLFSGVPDSGTFLWALGVHFLLALGYALVIAAAVFRLSPLRAVLTGGLVGLGLYALNFIVFRYGMGYPSVEELPIIVTHFAFALATAGAYKAFSVESASARGRKS